MSLHALSHPPGSAASGAAARILLRTHLDGRSWQACAGAAAAIPVPEALETPDDLVALAALAVAQTFGLLEGGPAQRVQARVEAALAGADAAALAAAAVDDRLVWCIAAAEWCERHGLDHAFARLEVVAEAADPSAAAWARVHWRIASAWHHEAFGRREAVGRLLAEAEGIADAAAEIGLRVNAWIARARLALSRSEPAAAQALAQRAEAATDARTTPLWLADIADIRSRAALLDGDMHRALHQSRRAGALAAAAGVTPSYGMTYRLYEAYALLGLGAHDEAVAMAQQLAATAQPDWLTARIALLAELFELIRADRRGPWGDVERARLAAATGRLRELDWPGVLALLPAAIARLWARALDEGIERDWLRASILARRLAPPEPCWPEAWPWAVRLRVLGPFVCEVDGQVLTQPGKAASKPLALLRRIALQGGFDGVPVEMLAAALWPGEGREGRDKAFETTLARLRRLLGHADAVLLQDRRVRLHPQRVWLDAAALQRRLDRLGRRRADTLAERQAAWQEVFGLLRGPLLADEPTAPWVDEARQALRSRLLAALEADAGLPGAAERRRRAVAADPALGV